MLIMPSIAYTKTGQYLDIQTLVTGSYVNDGPVVTYSYYGMGTTGLPSAFGSLTDGTSNLYADASILTLYYLNMYDKNLGESVTDQVLFTVSGTMSNSGWTTMTIGSETYLRSAATFTTPSGRSEWLWDAVTSAELTGGTKQVMWS